MNVVDNIPDSVNVEEGDALEVVENGKEFSDVSSSETPAEKDLAPSPSKWYLHFNICILKTC